MMLEISGCNVCPTELFWCLEVKKPASFLCSIDLFLAPGLFEFPWQHGGSIVHLPSYDVTVCVYFTV